jgi:hypothetical protein
VWIIFVFMVALFEARTAESPFREPLVLAFLAVAIMALVGPSGVSASARARS